MRDQGAFRQGKIDVLANYWDKILGRLTMTAS